VRWLTGYTAHTLDGIIDKVVRQIFDHMKVIPKSEVVNIRYKEKMEEQKRFSKVSGPNTPRPPPILKR